MKSHCSVHKMLLERQYETRIVYDLVVLGAITGNDRSQSIYLSGVSEHKAFPATRSEATHVRLEVNTHN